MSTCTLDSVVIRLCTPADIPELFRIVNDYAGEIDIDAARVKNSLRDLVYLQGTLCGEYNGMMIGGVAGYCFPSLFTDDTMFNVMFFYIRKRYRRLTKQFLHELNLSLLPTKVTKIVFGVPAQYPKLKRFMAMNGYKDFEAHVYKQL